MNKDVPTRASISITSICFLWGVITQALTWAGVISWPWQAIWGPILIIAGLAVIAIVVSLIVAVIVVLVKK